jgi:uncharacterized protein YceK
MKNILFASALILLMLTTMSGCTNVPLNEQSVDNKPTVEPETTLVPVKEVDTAVNAPTTDVLDTTLEETDSLLEDLESDSFTDLPSNLGQ